MNLNLLKNHLKYQKFSSDSLKVLIINSGYFLQREFSDALLKLNHKIRLVKLYPKLSANPAVKPAKENADPKFLENLLNQLVSFKPDFIFTVNMLGFDTEGFLANILSDLEIPVVNWFVDTPPGIMKNNKNLDKENFVSISWERDYLQPFKEVYHKHHIIYSPYGTSLKAPLQVKNKDNLKYQLSFVGSSMVSASEKWEILAEITKEQKKKFHLEISETDRNLKDFISDFTKKTGDYNLKNYYYFEGSRIIREKAISYLCCKHKVTVFGDQKWSNLDLNYTLEDFVNFYTELPQVYNESLINLNFTSPQMKTAVNQRVFDAPAAGSLLITDNQSDLLELFPENDFPVFDSLSELNDLIEYYQTHEAERKKIIQKLQHFIFNEHTYQNRLTFLIPKLKEYFL